MFASRLWRSYYSSSSTLSFVNHSRFQPSFLDPSRSLSSSRSNFYPFLTPDYVPFSPSISRNFASYSSVQPGPPSPSGKPSNSWKKWAAAMLLSIVTLPFGKDKLNSFLELKNDVEVILEDAELVADVVENVAEEVVKITDVLADQFPNGKNLKLVENVAKEIAKDANQAEDLIHEVQEVEKEVESFIEPVMGQVNSNVTKEASDGSITIDQSEKVPKSKL